MIITHSKQLPTQTKSLNLELLFLSIFSAILLPLIIFNGGQNFKLPKNSENYGLQTFISGIDVKKLLNYEFESKIDDLEKEAETQPEITDPFALAEEKFGIHQQILKAQFQIESEGGENLGNYSPAQTLYGKQLKAFNEICSQLGIDPQNQKLSRTGDMGPMQFQPATWQAYGLDANGDGQANPWDLQDAVLSSANYLSELGYSYSPRLALARYNGGYKYAGSSKAQYYAGLIIRKANADGANIN